MLPIDDLTLAALNGSRDGDKLEVFAWYGGRLSYPEPLPVDSWKLEWDGSASKQVQGVLEVTVSDPDGSLAPWLYEDPLGIGGAELMCRYTVGGAGTINRGWFRISGNAPKESWYSRVIPDSDAVRVPGSSVAPGHRLVMVSGGAIVPVTAEERTLNLLLDEFINPEQPAGASPGVISEIQRIVGPRMPVKFGAGVKDLALPADVTFDGPRIDAVMDLAGRAGASLRMGGDGELEVYVKDRTPVWTVAGGDDGALINIDREQKLDRLSNVGIARGEEKYTDAAGQEQTRPLVGVFRIERGPLSVNGPAGVLPRSVDSQLLDSQAEVDKAAESLITNYLDSLTVDLEVTCLPNPALQIGDWVTVTQPVVDGRLVPLDGEVVKMRLQSEGSTVGQMVMTVRCSAAAVQNIRNAFTR